MCSSMVVHVPSMHEALGSILNTPKKKKKKVYNSVACSMFALLYNHHLYLVPKHSIALNRNPKPNSLPPQAQEQHLSSSCLWTYLSWAFYINGVSNALSNSETVLPLPALSLQFLFSAFGSCLTSVRKCPAPSCLFL